jgi:malate dehydrogenase (oxaloacetate-decarboxylating)
VDEEGFSGTLHEALVGADVFIGVSGPNLFGADQVATMASGAIVLALANPDPEILPSEAAKHAAVVATGRSDFPNQINNLLAFPVIFRGALDCRASRINEELKVATSVALASLIPESELSETNIIPSALNKDVAKVVSAAVIKAAHETGVARI